MELWIRSQNKESLIPVNERIFMLDLHNGRNIEIKCGSYNILGIYKSKERALEVLDEIQEVIDNGIKETRYDSVGSKYYKVKTDKKVYEMPEE